MFIPIQIPKPQWLETHACFQVDDMFYWENQLYTAVNGDPSNRNTVVDYSPAYGLERAYNTL